MEKADLSVVQLGGSWDGDLGVENCRLTLFNFSVLEDLGSKHFFTEENFSLEVGRMVLVEGSSVNKGDLESNCDWDSRCSEASDFTEPLDCCPIAICEPQTGLFSHQNFCEMRLLVDDGNDGDLDASEWVRGTVKGLSRLLGVSFEEYEGESLESLLKNRGGIRD